LIPEFLSDPWYIRFGFTEYFLPDRTDNRQYIR
jgi:hypothetical protein